MKRSENDERYKNSSHEMMVEVDEDSVRCPQGFIAWLDTKASLFPAGWLHGSIQPHL